MPVASRLIAFHVCQGPSLLRPKKFEFDTPSKGGNLPVQHSDSDSDDEGDLGAKQSWLRPVRPVPVPVNLERSLCAIRLQGAPDSPWNFGLMNLSHGYVGVPLAASEDSADSDDSDDSEDDDELPSTIGSKRGAPQAKHSVKVRVVVNVLVASAPMALPAVASDLSGGPPPQSAKHFDAKDGRGRGGRSSGGKGGAGRSPGGRGGRGGRGSRR
jgi:hypothetical protein